MKQVKSTTAPRRFQEWGEKCFHRNNRYEVELHGVLLYDSNPWHLYQFYQQTANTAMLLPDSKQHDFVVNAFKEKEVTNAVQS